MERTKLEIEKQVKINIALRYFEPLSRRKINIFKEQAKETKDTSLNVCETIFHSQNGGGEEEFEFLTNVKVTWKDFAWMKGMGKAHALKMCEMCYELEKAGCSYIIEGKLKRTSFKCIECTGKQKHHYGGRPDITVLWYSEKANFYFLKLDSMTDEQKNELILASNQSRPFHIEVIDSEKELKKHKELSYPFVIVKVMAEVKK